MSFVFRNTHKIAQRSSLEDNQEFIRLGYRFERSMLIIIQTEEFSFRAGKQSAIECVVNTADKATVTLSKRLSVICWIFLLV